MELYNADCFEVLEMFANEGRKFDLILTDPPYNIRKAKWDKFKDFTAWSMRWISLCEQCLPQWGTLVFFNSDICQLAPIITELCKRGSPLGVNSFCSWVKPNFRPIAWRRPSANCNLCSWYNICEYFVVLTRQDDPWNQQEDFTRPDHIGQRCFLPIKEYFMRVIELLGVSIKDVERVMGNRTMEHTLRLRRADGQIISSQWLMPTREAYTSFADAFKLREWGGFREYEDLRREYEDLRAVHNLDDHHCNVFTGNTENTGDLHPTQKPVWLMERLVRCHSHPDHTVLDPFMGSGTTGVAAVSLGRDFVGIEVDEGYYSTAERRLAAVQLSIGL